MTTTQALHIGLPLAAVLCAGLAWRMLSRRAFLGLLLGVLLALVLGEVALRVAGAAEPGRPEWIEPLTLAAPSEPAYWPDGKLVYRYPSDPRGYFGPELTLEGSINALGLRGGTCRPEPSPGRTRVAVLGDSFTLGIGVRDEDTLPAQLEGLLGPQSVEVLNFGVSGSQTTDQVDYLLGYVLRFQPQLVVLVFFLNDAELGSTMDWLTRPRAFAGLRRHSHLLEGVVAGIERWSLRDDMLRHYREGYADSSPGWVRAREALRRAKAQLDELDVPLVVALHPVLVDLDGEDYPFTDVHRTLTEFCATEGIASIDLHPALQGNRTEDLWVHPNDRHPNEQCHRVSARAIARDLRRMGLLP